MSNVNVILSKEDGRLDFGDHTLAEKTKAEIRSQSGDDYKVKTYSTMTRLEKNESFLYESVPGTTVRDFSIDAQGVAFEVNGSEDAQITIGLADETSYSVRVDGEDRGVLKTNMSGKLNVSVELSGDKGVRVEIVKNG